MGIICDNLKEYFHIHAMVEYRLYSRKFSLSYTFKTSAFVAFSTHQKQFLKTLRTFEQFGFVRNGLICWKHETIRMQTKNWTTVDHIFKPRKRMKQGIHVQKYFGSVKFFLLNGRGLFIIRNYTHYGALKEKGLGILSRHIIEDLSRIGIFKFKIFHYFVLSYIKYVFTL